VVGSHLLLVENLCSEAGNEEANWLGHIQPPPICYG